MGQLFELTIECDDATATEVCRIALRRGYTPRIVKLAPSTDEKSSLKNAPKASPDAESLAKEQAWGALMGFIGEAQAQVLRTIKRHPEGVTSEQIGAALDRPTTSITGSLGGGLRPNIQKAGFDENDENVIVSKKIRGVWTYFPGPLLRSHDV